MSKPLKLQITPQALAAIRAKAKSTTEYYYSEQAALFSKKILDQLHETKLPVRIRPDGYAINSLRVQYYQGLRYLLDNLDPSKHYFQLSKITKCSTANKEYAEFTIRGTLASQTLETVVPWKDQFSDYLDTATPGKKLGPLDVSLSAADLQWIEGQLSGLVKPNGDPLFLAQVEIGKPLLLIRDED